MVNIRGFTLIEVLIVVTIIGILAAISYPFYNSYRERVYRADVSAYMLEVAHNLQRYYMARQTYQGVTIADVGRADFPKSGTQIYTIQIVDVAGRNLTAANANGQTWEMRAIPLAAGTMKNNGIICLNHLGQKYWEKGAIECDLSSTSNWDGR